MTTRLSSSSPAELKRRTIYITLIAAGANFIAVLEYLYFGYSTNAWQMYVLAFNTTVLALAGVVGAVLARRGQSERGVQLLLVTGSIAFGIAPFFVSGMGVEYGGGIAILVAMVAWQTLPKKQARQQTVWGIVAGLIAFSTDLTDLLAYRFPAPSVVSSGIFLLIALSILSFGYYNLREYRNYSLQSKLVVLIISLVVLSGATIAFVSNRLINTSLNRQIESDIYQIAQGQASEVASYLLDHLHILETLSLNQGIDQTLASILQTRPSNLENIQALNTQWHTADLQGENDDPLVAEVLNNEITGELDEFKGNFPEYVEVFITDPYGATVAATRRISDYYHGDQPWWQTAYNNGSGAIYIENPAYDTNSQTIAIRVTIPIFDKESEKLIGILRSTINIELLINLLKEAHFAQTGETELRFSNEEVLNPAIEKPLEQLSQGDIEALSQVSNTTSNIPYKGTRSLVSQALLYTHGTEHDEHAQVIADLGWQVIVHQNEVEALAPNQSITRTLFLIMLGILAVASGGVFVLARFLTVPIVQLTRAAEQITAGNLAIQAEVQTGDEIGVLADTFNSMTAQLRGLVTGLEQRVAERTKALATSTEVSRRLSTILDQGELVREVVSQIQQAFNYYHVHIYLWDAKRENLLMAGGTGEAGRVMLESGHFIPAERGLVGRAAELGTVVLVPNVAQTIGWLPNPLLPDTKAEVAVPIRLGETVLGVLDVQQNTVDGLSQNDADLLLAIANQIAIALQNAQAYAVAQRQANLEAQRNEIIQKIQNTTTIEDALKVAVRELGRATEVPKAVVRLNPHDSFSSQ